MTAPNTLWAVTQTAHNGCQECAALIPRAITHVGVVGSASGGFSERLADGNEHSVSITRALTAVIRSGTPSEPDQSITPDTTPGTPGATVPGAVVALIAPYGASGDVTAVPFPSYKAARDYEDNHPECVFHGVIPFAAQTDATP